MEINHLFTTLNNNLSPLGYGHNQMSQSYLFEYIKVKYHSISCLCCCLECSLEELNKTQQISH